MISAPVHVQDFPARRAPQMGEEGSNVLFDTWVHPLMMGLEEHLLHMFKDDFEFNDSSAPSHLGSAAQPSPNTLPAEAQAVAEEVVDAPEVAPAAPLPAAASPSSEPIVVSGPAPWTPDAEKELKKIPFFVRGKARRNTEAYAGQLGLTRITVETPLRCQSALQPLTRRPPWPCRPAPRHPARAPPTRCRCGWCWSRWTATWPAPRAGPAAAWPGNCRAWCSTPTPPTNGAATSAPWSAARPTSGKVTS